MINESYPVMNSPDFKKNEFVSFGKRGDIHKLVHFLPTKSPYIFNLGFGDMDKDGNISDIVVSDNGDGEKSNKYDWRYYFKIS